MKTAHRSPFVILAIALGLVAIFPTPDARARVGVRARPARVLGITNFGRVTPTLFRGGDFMPDGIKTLVDRGVHTIISLRQKDGVGEVEACKKYGIDYYRFPMNTHTRPDSTMIDSILGLLRTAKPAIYVHCESGHHRTGVVCALYRIRVQGWSPKQAWIEQEFFGFGPPEAHPELFRFVYGDGEALKP